ncbi:DEAD/DEAH box helicase [Fimbriiglobus ruber]|uniref:Putative membrane protein n=1 Tax=Fimbriiglobus ruber TaxID=1908690 RepID=A0A225D717_9BACT|nr:DEAD/DEAH box helicase [Fimbriiglobus ruber]OWK37390.1 putative membrane protein [Fimbriiglobus ruber]
MPDNDTPTEPGIGPGPTQTPTAGKYRPFAEARAFVRSLGLKSQREWSDYCKSGRRPVDIPTTPHTVYAEWVDLKDWLGSGKGSTKSFEEVQEYARSLGIRTFEEWKAHVKGGLPPGIPRNPQDTFRIKGFTTWRAFLDRKYLPFAEARALVRTWGLRTKREWKARTEQPDFPRTKIPSSPWDTYRADGWVSLDDWLGNENRWSRPQIRGFLDSLLPVVHDLSPAELLVILKRKGLFEGDFRKNSNRSILEDLIKLLNANDPAGVVQNLVDRLDQTVPPTDLSPTDTPTGDGEPPPLGEDTLNGGWVGEPEQPRDPDTVDGVADIVNDDQSVLDFLIENRVAGYWQRVLTGDPTFSVEDFRRHEGGTRSNLTRDRFLEEYDAAMSLLIPPTYAYQKVGRLAPPLPMQRLIAYRVLKQKCVGNWSGVGAGKTVSAILSALVVEAQLTVVLAFNSTLEMWEGEIKKVCPTAQVAVKSRGPFEFPGAGPAFVVMNYESFQQEWAKTEFVPHVTTAGRRLDMVIIDEIQTVRQRSGAEESARRGGVNHLLNEARARNENLRVLGMSATPVINDLHEARVTLEMITGRSFAHIPTRYSVANAITFHQQMIRHGLRLRPRYPVTVEEAVVTVDGRPVLDDLRALGRIRLGGIHALERVLLRAKLDAVRDRLRPGTLVYTQFIEGFVDELIGAAIGKGLSVGVFTGDDKSGLDRFRNRLKPDVPAADRCDVLIGSAPVGTGVDGLQEVGDRLIFASLPWTAAEYDQVIGRLKRHGARFERIEVFVPQVVLTDGNSNWSWDAYRFQCIRFKRTLADAVIDGTVPEGRLPTRDEMFRQSLATLQEWMDRVARD